MKAIMKKKGFTLVELLAVIAILAILVIIALPNVTSMFNQAKENSFTTEIKEIYKQAQQQWISDSMMSTEDITYWRAGGDSASTSTNKKGIDLTGRTELDYYIVINKAGKITKYYASDGSYQYMFINETGNNEGLLVEDIGKAEKHTGKITNALAYHADTGVVDNNVVKQISSLAKTETLIITKKTPLGTEPEIAFGTN